MMNFFWDKSTRSLIPICLNSCKTTERTYIPKKTQLKQAESKKNVKYTKVLEKAPL